MPSTITTISSPSARPAIADTSVSTSQTTNPPAGSRACSIPCSRSVVKCSPTSPRFTSTRWPPTQSIATVPRMLMKRNTAGIERTILVPVWRTRCTGFFAIFRPMSSIFTSSATAP